MSTATERPIVFISATLGASLRNRLRNRLGTRCTCSLIGKISQLKRKRTNEFLIVSRLSDISRELLNSIRSHVEAANRRYLVFLEDLPVEALAQRLAFLDVRRPDRLHLVGVESSSDREDLLARLLGGLCRPSSEDSIAHAWVENDELILLSPRFRRLRVPIASLLSLKPLRDCSTSDLTCFRIDPDGSYIHWPTIDTHMGWEQFEALVSPHKQFRREQESHDFNRRYGRAIRNLRQESGLSQSQVEGLTERHLRRIEKGEQRATLSSLRALARAHGLSTEEYLALLRKDLK